MRFKPSVFIYMISLVLMVNVKNVLGLDWPAGRATENYEGHFDSSEELSGGVPPGYMLIEGDILVPEDFFKAEAAYQTNLWDNNQVPYEFDTDFTIPPPPDVPTGVTTANQALLQIAMQEWENVANVDFVQCLNNNCTGNYLHIQNATENSSHVGMIGDEQVVNIFNWNNGFIMAHELGHALGYWHEHQRGDRDQYLEIHPGNVNPNPPNGCDNVCFAENFGSNAPNNYGPFDFDSVMHYGECAFALPGCPCAVPANCQTIEVLMNCDTTTNECTNKAMEGRTCNNDLDCDPRLIGVCNTLENTCKKGRVGQPCNNNANCNILLGQRDHFSRFDALVMSFLYPETNWRFVDKSFTGTESGTFLKPFNTFNEGITNVPSGGTLVIQPGNYNGVGTYTKKMTWMGPVGGVRLGD